MDPFFGQEKPPRRANARKAAPAPFLSWRRLGRYTLVAAIWVGLIGGIVLTYFASTLPNPHQVIAMKRRPAITIKAQDGSVIGRYGDLYGSTVTVSQLPPYVIQAFLATEDTRFYHHFGIDPIGLVRAVFVDWRAGAMVQGGSTITQQLAKNLFLTPARTMGRKIQEAMLAIWIERLYTKDQILTGYLNRVYFGGGAYGIDAASHTYFNKPATELTLSEAALLAGLLKAPSHYAPTSNSSAAFERAQTVLERMKEAGYITDAQLQALSNTPPLPPRKPGTGESVKYFTNWIVDQLDSYTGHADRDLIVTTTLDPTLELSAEHHLQEILQSPQAENAHATQAALVTLAHDGAIRAMVGGRDYSQSQFNRATQALRQPGSSFKPIYYLAALENGMTPETMVEDAPITIGHWSPQNFEDGYLGEIPMREALAYSINTASVRIMQSIGVNKAIEMAHRLGISEQLDPDFSLALGTNEVNLLEMAGVYATFANDGGGIWPYAITEIRDRDQKLLYQRSGEGAGNQVVDTGHVEELNSMLAGVIDHGTGKGAKLDRPAAGKTGTSQDYHDAWFLGFTADFTTGVWIGNDDNAPMKKITGGSLPVQLWKRVMIDAEHGLPPGSLSGVEDGYSKDSTTPEQLSTTQPVPAKSSSGFFDMISDLLSR